MPAKKQVTPPAVETTPLPIPPIERPASRGPRGSKWDEPLAQMKVGNHIPLEVSPQSFHQIVKRAKVNGVIPDTAKFVIRPDPLGVSEHRAWREK